MLKNVLERDTSFYCFEEVGIFFATCSRIIFFWNLHAKYYKKYRECIYGLLKLLTFKSWHSRYCIVCV